MNEYGALVEWQWQQKLKYLYKTCTSATLSTKNPIQTGLGLTLSLHGERPVTIHLAIIQPGKYSTWTDIYERITSIAGKVHRPVSLGLY